MVRNCFRNAKLEALIFKIVITDALRTGLAGTRDSTSEDSKSGGGKAGDSQALAATRLGYLPLIRAGVNRIVRREEARHASGG